MSRGCQKNAVVTINAREVLRKVVRQHRLTVPKLLTLLRKGKLPQDLATQLHMLQWLLEP